MAAFERRGGAILRFRVAHRDDAHRGVFIRDTERLAQLRLIEHAEEDRAEPGVDRGEKRQERGHPGVHVPVRHWPPLFVHVGPALVRFGITS